MSPVFIGYQIVLQRQSSFTKQSVAFVRIMMGGGLLPLHIPTYTKVKQYQKMAIWHSLPVPFVLGSTCQAAPPPLSSLSHYATEVSEKFVSLVLCNSDCT